MNFESMNLQLNTLFDNIEGKWLSHKTIYYLNTKKININKCQKQIIRLKNLSLENNGYICRYKNLSDQEIVYNYIPTTNKYSTFGILQKIYNNCIKEYQFQLKDNNNLKIRYIRQDIKYTEYIYTVNTNFRISIVIIKRLNQYIAICFNSEIKII
uniref:Ycf58 n=1 Tax=Anunuuluaehu liula TaxID=3049639 RepID=UPI003002F6EE